MFPQGPPGIGLLLLRVSVAVALLVDGGLAGALPGGAWPAIVLAAALCLGVLTPIVATICGVAGIAVLLGVDGDGIAALAVIAALAATALALLGPGAYSLDARLFGRRLLALPPND